MMMWRPVLQRHRQQPCRVHCHLSSVQEGGPFLSHCSSRKGSRYSTGACPTSSNTWSHTVVPATRSRTAAILSSRDLTTMDRSPCQLWGSEPLQNCTEQGTNSAHSIPTHWGQMGVAPHSHRESQRVEVRASSAAQTDLQHLSRHMTHAALHGSPRAEWAK